MGKKKDQARAKKDARRSAKGAHDGRAGASASAVAVADAQAGGPPCPADRPKMSAKAFEGELERLQIELVKLQEWVKATGAKVCVLFEGRDAGKGGIIKRSRSGRVRASSASWPCRRPPSARSRRCTSSATCPTSRPPARSSSLRPQLVQPRRRRAGDGLHPEEVASFLRIVPVERVIIASGVRLIKYWLEVSMEHQTERFEERIHDGRKIWKLSPMDLEAHRRWYDFSRARDAMFKATDTPESPWYVVDANDQRRMRLNCIAHFLSLIPYEEVRGSGEAAQTPASRGLRRAGLPVPRVPEAY